jgi:virginiamycin B lyase
MNRSDLIIAARHALFLGALFGGIGTAVDAAPRSIYKRNAAPVLTFTRVAGTSLDVAPASDGSLWATSVEPAGETDKRILHDVNGTYSGTPGYGYQLSVAPNLTPYLVATNGGIYGYVGSKWIVENTSARKASAVAASADNGFYMLSKTNVVAGNATILRKDGFGQWSQLPGMGAKIVASLDPTNHQIPGVGNIPSYGYFVLTATGAITYYSPTGTYVYQFPGTASAIAPVPGGFYQLAYPQTANGAQLSYFDYRTGTLTAEPYSFANITAYSPSGDSQVLYGTDPQGRIYSSPIAAFVANVTIGEYPLPNANTAPRKIVAGPDGAMWFTEFPPGTQGDVGRITTGGQVREFSLTTALTPQTQPLGIAAGPDGNLWIADANFYLDRLSPTGKLNQFPDGQNDSADSSICEDEFVTAGPDGAMWTTEACDVDQGAYSDGNLQRFTVAGVSSNYGGVSNSSPFDLATGSDGALWFTDPSGFQIDRVTTTGTQTTYTMPGGYGPPATITPGPDGALWFTEQGTSTTNYIGRLTTTGSFTQYAAPLAYISGITAGPDGALWFTESTGKIGRITVAGKVTEYPLPAGTGGDFTSIARGPDGALWFTLDTGAIGRARFR